MLQFVVLLLGVGGPVTWPAQDGVTAAPPAERRAATEVFARNSPAVVTIRTPIRQGSGVLLDTSGVLVTNLHILAGARKATVILANGDAYDDVRVIDVDTRRDLVLLKIKGYRLPTAELGDSDDLAVGAQVFAIGSPRGLSASISEGLVSALRPSGDGYRVIQTTAAISPGSSGGGLFDTAGRLMAITTFAVSGGEALNFAVPINYVRGMLALEPRMSLEELAASAGAPPPTPARAAAPKLARVYVSGASADLLLFEPRADGTIEATLSTGGGVIYGRATLTWDPERALYAGRGTQRVACGGGRFMQAPVSQEVAVVGDTIIKDRWSTPARVNCGRNEVVAYDWTELIRFVPAAK